MSDVVDPADVAAAWETASSRVTALLDDPDRASVQIDVAVVGMRPAREAVDLVGCGDLLVHIWELSRATGQDGAPRSRRGRAEEGCDRVPRRAGDSLTPGSTATR